MPRITALVSVSPELNTSFSHLISFSYDLTLVSNFLTSSSFVNLSPPLDKEQPSHRKRPTARSTTWKGNRLLATATSTSDSTDVTAPTVAAPSIPTGRCEVLRHLIHHATGAWVAPDSLDSSVDLVTNLSTPTMAIYPRSDLSDKSDSDQSVGSDHGSFYPRLDLSDKSDNGQPNDCKQGPIEPSSHPDDNSFSPTVSPSQNPSGYDWNMS